MLTRMLTVGVAVVIMLSTLRALRATLFVHRYETGYCYNV